MTVQKDTPLSIEGHINDLSSTVDHLVDILGRETVAVKEIDIKEFSSIQALKSDALNRYNTHLHGLLLQKEKMKMLPDTIKNRIRTFEEKLSIARMENMAALDRAGKSMMRLRDRIAQIARDTVIQNGASYGPNGRMYSNVRKAISTGLSDQA